MKILILHAVNQATINSYAMRGLPKRNQVGDDQ